MRGERYLLPADLCRSCLSQGLHSVHMLSTVSLSRRLIWHLLQWSAQMWNSSYILKIQRWGEVSWNKKMLGALCSSCTSLELINVSVQWILLRSDDATGDSHVGSWGDRGNKVWKSFPSLTPAVNFPCHRMTPCVLIPDNAIVWMADADNEPVKSFHSRYWLVDISAPAVRMVQQNSYR